jgi:hypothetical protein
VSPLEDIWPEQPDEDHLIVERFQRSGSMGYTLVAFAQDRGSDLYHSLFLWLYSLIDSCAPSGVETKACVPLRFSGGVVL